MRRNALLIGLLVFLPTAGGCDGGSGEEADAGTDTASSTDEQCDGVSWDGALVLSDSENYSFSGDLDIKFYPLAEMSDPLFDWSGLTEDLQGHALDPVGDIDQISVIIFNNLSEEEVEIGLSQDSLSQSEAMLFVSKEVGDSTAVHISELTLLGTEIYGIDYNFEQTEGATWLLSLAKGTILGVGTRMAAFIRPDPDTTDTVLHVSNDSTVLTFDAEIALSEELPTVAGSADLNVDWGNLTLNSQGNEFMPFDIDEIMVAHYLSKTPADLEAEFLDLELIADAVWRMEVEAGYTADLSELSGESGVFAGIDDLGTWILALRCNTCSNPAPPFLTVMHPCL